MSKEKKTGNEKRKRIFVISIAIPAALLHFATGKNYTGPFPVFVNSYLLDVFIPFVFYFLLSLRFQDFRIKLIIGVLLFSSASMVEVLQYYDVPLLGHTFDPIDFAMYGIGVLMAIIIDGFIISKRSDEKINF